jgi:hypothetical protein
VLTTAQYVLTARLSTLLAYSAAAFGITTSLFSIWARGTYTAIFSDSFVSSSIRRRIDTFHPLCCPMGNWSIANNINNTTGTPQKNRTTVFVDLLCFPAPISTCPVATTTHEASWSQEFRVQVRQARAWRMIGVYALSAGASTIVYSLLAASLGKHRYAPLAPTKRHALHINENIVFLVLGNMLVASVVAVKDLAQHRWAVQYAATIVSFLLDFNSRPLMLYRQRGRMSFSIEQPASYNSGCHLLFLFRSSSGTLSPIFRFGRWFIGSSFAFLS